jgi:hypothetical protein
MRMMRCSLFLRLLIAVLLPAGLGAQGITLRVVDALEKPIPFAYVAVDGAKARYTDAKGEVLIGRGSNRQIWLDVRRLGFAPYKEKLVLPDSEFVFAVALQALPNTLTAVQIIAKGATGPLENTGFYKRALDFQKGAGTAVFIGPEELENRNPSKATDALRGQRGIDIKRENNTGKMIATTRNGLCQIPVLVDGVRVVSTKDFGGNSLQQRQNGTSYQSIDDFVDGNAITAMEVYPRGAMVPQELQVPDAACGLIVVWTGSRK